MDFLAGFLGFGCFVLISTMIGLIGYWQADRLESWARERFGPK